MSDLDSNDMPETMLTFQRRPDLANWPGNPLAGTLVTVNGQGETIQHFVYSPHPYVGIASILHKPSGGVWIPHPYPVDGLECFEHDDCLENREMAKACAKKRVDDAYGVGGL